MRTEPLYKKVGRRYVPVEATWFIQSGIDRMDVGSFRLAYAYKDGATRYEYEVTPDTAAFSAAMMIAREAMEKAMLDAAKATPHTTVKPYTKKQLALIKKFIADMGDMRPAYWQVASPYQIAEAAMQAVKEHRP